MSRAVILAAGEGVRLRGVWEGPKGLIEIGGERLIDRSLRLLRAAGVTEVHVVVGARAAAWPALSARVWHHSGWAAGALSTLQFALERVEAPFLLLESDLWYEPRALQAVRDAPGASVVLCSGPTGATDEVWVSARAGALTGMAKRREALEAVVGEFVGISRIGAALVAPLQAARGGAYDEDGLVQAAARAPIEVVCVPDLVWGELDDATHLARLRRIAAASP